jgi:ATP-binding cassette subfamily B protein
MAEKQPMKSDTVFSVFSKETLRYPGLFTLSIFGVLISAAADLTSPLYLKQFINTLALQTVSASIVHGLVMTLVIIGILYVAEWIGMRIMSFSLIYLESRAISHLYTLSFKYLIDHSYHFFSSQFSGTLTRRVSKFANAYERILDSVITQFLPTALFVTGAVVILFIRNHTLGLMLGVWVLFFLSFQLVIARKLRPLRVASALEDSRLTGSLADAISNQTTIGLFSGNVFERSRFATAVEKWRRIKIQSWSTNDYIWAALGFLVVGINIGLLFAALYFWQKGQLTIGDFVLIQAYLITTIQQLFGINRSLRGYYDSYSDAEEMITILNTPHEIQDIPNAPVLQVPNGEISLKNVTFFFSESHPILSDFNLHIQAGEKMAFVGSSGAGKSTITRLLLRQYNVKSGFIEIDSQDIARVTQNSLREAIAFVPQEPILFHRTLMENIRYGRRDATDEEVLEASRKAHCHEFISGFPEQYETFVGERGVKLSGGERQRVAIARAILKNAPILILDEATSSLDSESESFIQDALATLMEGKTVIVIAHRLSTIMKMDRIVVIDEGKIVAQGTHDELLTQGGLYQKLWNIQAGGFIREEE